MNKFKFALLTLITIILLCIVYFITYTFVEPKVYDYMVKNVLTEKLPFDNVKNVYGHDDIILIITDKDTVKKYRWPWKRELYCKVLNYFYEYAKPKVFFHDSLLLSLDEENPESDKKYFDSIHRFENMVEGFMPNLFDYEDKKKGAEYDKNFTEKYGIKAELNIDKYPDLYESILMFPQPYFDAVNNAGSVRIFAGFITGNLHSYARDAVYRNNEYITYYKGSILPSASMKVFLLANNNPKMIIRNNYTEFPELNYKIRHKITDEQIFYPTKYYKFRKDSSYSHIKYSALDIMDSYDNIKQGKKPIIDPSVFKDKIIVYGAYVPAGDGLNDKKTTPMSKNHAGSDVQATNIDNIIHNDFLKIIPMWVNILLTIIFMLVVYFSIKLHKIIKAISYSLLIIMTIIISGCACYYYGIVIPIITPIVMCIVTMIIAYVHRYIIEEKNKEKVENALGKYMSEDVKKRVLQNIDNLGLGGKKSTATVLFSDIRGFTSLSESMSAQKVSQLLNEYFSAMEPIVSKYNGIINKFIGDAIMAVFGEPIQDENHPKNAVKCGFEMLNKVKELNKKWESEGNTPIQIGVGISTGEVFVGNIGSERRMEYTVIGDTVNLASRLESYNKIYKTHILISSKTYENAADIITVNKISNAEIRGKAAKIDIYEVTDCKYDI